MPNSRLIRQVDAATAPQPEPAVSALQPEHTGAASNIFWHPGQVSIAARERHYRQRAATIWLTGLSGAGKSTIAYELEKMLFDEGRPSFVLDGDNIRQHLNSDLGFSPDSRKENIRRTAEVARLMNDAGLFVITAFISPFREDRAMASRIVGEQKFIEVHVSTPVDVCEARDPKGLYAKARLGLITQFTGVSAPYEAPLCPALVLDTGALRLKEATCALYRHLSQRFD